jgi:hypothetical protein
MSYSQWSAGLRLTRTSAKTVTNSIVNKATSADAAAAVVTRKSTKTKKVKSEECSLHPDLRPWVYTCSLGRRLQHPLVHALLDWEGAIARANKAYQLKKDDIDRSLREKGWISYLMFHERPFRVDAARTLLHNGVAGAEFGELLRHVWIDSENIYQNRRVWRDFWEIPDIEAGVMNEEERDTLAALPDVVTVYRGTEHPQERQPLSWTLDQKKARWFAVRFYRDGYLVTGETKKADIRALLLGRNETEVVTLRVRRVGR